LRLVPLTAQSKMGKFLEIQLTVLPEDHVAELKLIALEELLDPGQQDKLLTQLADLGIKELPKQADEADFDSPISDDQLTDFMDRLDAHDAACTIYLPVEFDASFELDGYTVGSIQTLLDALEEIGEELDIDSDGFADEEEVDEEDEEGALAVFEQQLEFAWRVFTQAANACATGQLPLHVID
jgi:hypothetical protein